MRRILPLLCAALLLCGCGAKTEERFEAWREDTAERELRFGADVTASEGERTWCFSAAAESMPGETAITLTAPAEIAGIVLRCGEDCVLEYDGAVLVLPDVTADGVSPAAALPLFCRALRTGRLLRCGKTPEDGLWAELREDGTKTWVVTFDSSMTPLEAELTEDGHTALYCKINGFGTGG